ncbi:helix-turn-helix domain-containing protein [Pantoea sp. JGM49]|uniref:winged helix-turn-helix transcriptional regulator n=1 Tax=Pantoea sp. JGM49 TaxID=2799791 RepID=UPI0032C45713
MLLNSDPLKKGQNNDNHIAVYICYRVYMRFLRAAIRHIFITWSYKNDHQEARLGEKTNILPPEDSSRDQPCVIRDVIDSVGDRWSLLTLGHLARSPLRFVALQRAIGDISKQVLSRTLKRLEEDGFISRTVHSGKPLQVVYALTEMGHSFINPLQALLNWAKENQDTITDAREKFELKYVPDDRQPHDLSKA